MEGEASQPDQENSHWVIASFHEAEEDIRWAKERATNATYWSVLLIAGITAATRISGRPPITSALLFIPLIGIVGLAWWWLAHLHHFASRSRNAVDAFSRAFPPQYRYPQKRLRDRDHNRHFWIQMSVVGGAALFALVEIVLAVGPDWQALFREENMDFVFGAIIVAGIVLTVRAVWILKQVPVFGEGEDGYFSHSGEPVKVSELMSLQASAWKSVVWGMALQVVGTIAQILFARLQG